MVARAAAMPEIPPGPWIDPPPLSESTVAIISTAGMHRRSDERPEEAGPGQWSCPLSIPPPDGEETLVGRLLVEVGGLRPSSAETRRYRGRGTVGASGASVEQVADVARALAAVAETGELAAPAGGVAWAFPQPLLLRHLADDLRTFYHEASRPSPGPGAPNHAALNEWIFGGTRVGEVLAVVAERLTADGTPAALLVRGLLIPEGHYKGDSAFPATAEFGATPGTGR